MIDQSPDLTKNSEQRQGPRIGVYVCYCGGNISDVVDVQRVVQAASHLDDVCCCSRSTGHVLPGGAGSRYGGPT